MTDKLLKRIQLTDKEYRSIKQLFATCERFDKSSARVYWNCIKSRAPDVYHDYLLFKRELLICYLGIFNFKADEVEVCALVHPLHRRKGSFNQLLKTAIYDINYKEIKRILLPCTQDFDVAKLAVEKLGANYKHSEYTLEIKQLLDLTVDATPQASNSISMVKATDNDLDLIAHLDSVCFDSPIEEGLARFSQTLSNTDRQAYLAQIDGKTIGKIHLHIFENKVFIHDFCISPEYQGKKFGHDLLTKTLKQLQTEGYKHIELDVIATNKQAINLYIKCGFQLRHAYDYYQLLLEKIKPELPPKKSFFPSA